MSAPRALTAFGRFWWDFIVGDTPEVAVGVAAIVTVAWWLATSAAAIAFVLVPLAVVALLVGSTWRGRSSS